jgi:hypothetical protein
MNDDIAMLCSAFLVAIVRVRLQGKNQMCCDLSLYVAVMNTAVPCLMLSGTSPCCQSPCLTAPDLEMLIGAVLVAGACFLV